MLMALPTSEVGKVSGKIGRLVRREQPPVLELIGDVDEGVGDWLTGVYAGEERIWRSWAKLGVPLPVAGSHPVAAVKPFVPHPMQEQLSYAV